MKKFKTQLNFKNGVLLAIALMIICIVISICIAEKIGTNTASIIGGVLSAIATVFLGLIAIWQNTKYKKMADEANDIQVRPEFFALYYSSDYESAREMPSITVFRRGWMRDKDARDDVLCYCKVLNYPIVRIKPIKLTYYIDGHISDAYSEFEVQTERNLVLEKGTVFRIVLKTYIQLDDIYLEVEYENIFGNKYQKVIEFFAPSKNELPEASVFGTFLSGKVRLYPAERAEN